MVSVLPRMWESSARRLDHELTVGPDGRFVLADRNPLVDAMHALEIARREAEWQEAEDILTQPAVVPCVGRHDNQIWGNDRVGSHAPDRPLKLPETVGVRTGHTRRFGGKAAYDVDFHTVIVDDTSHVLVDGGDAVAGQDPEVDDRPRVA